MARDVRLRNVSGSDLPIFFEQQRDADAVRMAAFPARDRAAFDAHWAKILRDPTVTTRTVVCGGEVAGNVGSWEHSGQTYVGYWIGKDYWGQGVATQGLAQFLGLVAARPLYARVARGNVASIRVLEKCGFVIVGRDIAPADPSGGSIEELILRLDAPPSAAIP